MKNLWKYGKAFLLLIGSYLLFMIIACLFPEEAVHRNIKRSVDDIRKEGNYAYAVMQYPAYQMDNFTDALMMATAWEANAGDLRSSLFENRHANVGMDMSVGLQNLVDQDYNDTKTYARYWHGNSFLMRILLFFGNYTNIRFFLYLFSSLVLVVACCLLYPRIGLPYTLAFFSGFFLLNGFVTQLSLQMFSCVMIAIISSVVICFKWEDLRAVGLVFFVTGSLTAFFDLLTTPLITVGMPLIMYLIMNRKRQEKESLWKGASGMAALSGIWFLGYLGTWATKWALSSIFTEQNVFKDAFLQSVHRSEIGEDFTRMDAVRANLEFMPWETLLTLCILLAVASILCFNREHLKSVLLTLPLVAVPYVWFWLISDHSFKHCWFTYRLQMVAISAAIVLLCYLVEWDKLQKKMRIKHLFISKRKKRT
ncbi:MAG: hypothetical protein J5642_01750 [Bacteroidales bacterium]|nr:hypothetical protein [Bacteroidales bacterium]